MQAARQAYEGGALADYLHEAINGASVPAVETLANLAARFPGSDAADMALKQMMAMVRQQASVMSFADLFLILTLLFVALAAFGIVMRRPASAAAVAGH